MAWAICSKCGAERYWRAVRGARLADQRCACGGALRGKTAGSPSVAAGRSYERCAVCGKRGLNLIQLRAPRRSFLDGRVLHAFALVHGIHAFRITPDEAQRLWPDMDAEVRHCWATAWEIRSIDGACREGEST